MFWQGCCALSIHRLCNLQPLYHAAPGMNRLTVPISKFIFLTAFMLILWLIEAHKQATCLKLTGLLLAECFSVSVLNYWIEVPSTILVACEYLMDIWKRSWGRITRLSLNEHYWNWHYLLYFIYWSITALQVIAVSPGCDRSVEIDIAVL